MNVKNIEDLYPLSPVQQGMLVPARGSIIELKNNDTQKQFNCFLIGEGSLPIQCAELLLERGHQICGIISPDASISHWAKEKNIPYIWPTDNLIAFLRQQPFDYLFSIVNSAVLRKEILELPRQYAINYHDAPLPRYAGLYATSWALMHQEKTHGVTWHVMSDLVDAGDILKQFPIDIADDETAFTLNGKCYEAAIHSFAQLIDELANGQALVSKQNLNERTYFPRSKRLSAGGLLSFNRCAHDIDADLRALDFGPYPNPLGLAKLAIGSDLIIVPKLKVLNELSQSLPGTVTAIEHNFLKVSTATYEIALLQVLNIDGQTLSIPNLVARFGLQVGYRFKNVEPDIARRIEALDALIPKHEAFWVERLATLEPITIPYAQSKASHSKQKLYADVLMPVPHEVITFLKECHPAWNQSDFLLAAFAAYLARIGGIYCFDIGFRDVELQRELVGLEGFFASHVPCRLNVGDEQSFEEVFEAVREIFELTKLHKFYARDAVARYPALGSVPKLLNENMFPVIIERVERLDDHKAGLGNELTLVIPEDGKECCWLYDAEALDGDSIARMLRSFATFLQGIVTDTTQRIAYLPLLSEEERHKILAEWNDTQVDYPKDACIHQLFEAQVERNPDAVAVVFEDKQLTYQELNRRANQVAHYLHQLGVGSEVFVGICVERSLEMVVGLLGILKAGGAFVPLDPQYPKSRLAFMLHDTQASILLTQKRLIECLPSHVAKVVCLDADWNIISISSDENPASLATAENLANVIYTSGSTGQPKGVMIPHRGICNHLLWMQVAFQLTEVDRVLQKASISFDVSVFEVFWPLLAGLRLILAKPGGQQDTAYLVKLIAEQKITFFHTVPSMLQVLLEEQHIETCNCLRHVTSGGEALPNDLKERFFAQMEAQLHNAYGPTEASIGVIYGRCKRGSNQHIVPIGQPIANTQIYVLDSHLQPQPIGVPGELYIGGVGLARGYLNQPELTVERFIPNPFSNQPGARLYKTGDLARYQPNGNIEYLGRIDHQVKIRGFRIELGEIEAVLGQYPALRETVVIAREDVTGDKRLVAYIVPNPEQVPSTSDLRRFLQQQLPDYMIPSAFVILEALPLTPNGKVNHRALPTPELSRPELEKIFVAPRDSLELQLTEIWEKVLGIQRIGVRDSFFELGGHSLLAVRLFAQIEKIIGKNLNLATIFQAPTVEQQARIIHQEGWSAPWSSLVKIKSGDSKPPFFGIHGGYSSALLYYKLAQYMGSEQPFYGLQPQGLDGKQVPHTRVEDMAALYLSEIRTLQQSGPYFLGGYSIGGKIAFEMAQQLHRQGEKVALLALFDTLTAGFFKPLPFHARASRHLSKLSRLELKAKLTYVKEKLARRFESVNKLPSLKPRYDSPLRDAHLQADRDYVPQVYSGRVILFRASEPFEEWLEWCSVDSHLGWGELVAGGLELQEVPGNHFNMFNEPYVQVLAEKLKACLAQAQTNYKETYR